MPSDYETHHKLDIHREYGYRNDNGQEWVIYLDKSQVDEDDPGAGVPAIIRGPDGEQATVWAAYNEGEIDGHPLPFGVMTWIEDRIDDCNDFLYPPAKPGPHPENLVERFVCAECGNDELYRIQYRVQAYAAVTGFESDTGDAEAEDWDWGQTEETEFGFECVRGHRVPDVETGEEMARWIEENSNVKEQ